jgi:serine protease
VRPDIGIDGRRIGYTNPATNPENRGDQVGPLDGGIDELSGHGTFIAGLVHQGCPDADIAAWRVVNSSGPIVESDWVNGLTQVAELVRRYYDGDPDGHPVDVLNMSMGYYHETPEDHLFDPTMYHLVELLGECGTVVTCSAGNDATARPLFPAAFAPWSNGKGQVQPSGECVPVVSVGALNPNTKTVALFSNTGPWVRSYANGAAVLSTMPPLQGGLQPMARTRAYGRVRESIDPDDFTGQFAVWSGTSFAAPLQAGRIASLMLDKMPARDAAPSRAEAVQRGWDAVSEATSITP